MSLINQADLPIIGVSKDQDGTKIIKFGKFVGTLFPEVYQKFVFKLHKEHPDLISAMQIAQVSLEDGSAWQFLAHVLDVEVLQDMTMEMGFSILYAGLEKRQGSRALEGIAKQAAEGILHDKVTVGKFRSDEDTGKPLFPSFDELKDKELFNKAKNWKDEGRIK